MTTTVHVVPHPTAASTARRRRRCGIPVRSRETHRQTSPLRARFPPLAHMPSTTTEVHSARRFPAQRARLRPAVSRSPALFLTRAPPRFSPSCVPGMLSAFGSRRRSARERARMTARPRARGRDRVGACALRVKGAALGVWCNASRVAGAVRSDGDSRSAWLFRCLSRLASRGSSFMHASRQRAGGVVLYCANWC
jgi:hypothetical protein